ncbi:hypothetical protein PoB_003065100 [Plakobranchus ocellatus]|uniref:Uncharacterized protein n=1 Tax=Plakobranchus ocellatus TaxID=259542 RepID=A0AAV4A7C2_9GAST|nr:hypothetical protein PoB_003065100 [Plakobranchus ocellatus]
MSWNATTLDGVHLSEIHINMPGKALPVDIRKLPGRTSTYRLGYHWEICYWSLEYHFYGDQQNSSTNAALHQAANNLEAFQQQGFTFTRFLRDIFGQQMPNDARLQTLLSFGSDEADLTNVLSMLITAI